MSKRRRELLLARSAAIAGRIPGGYWESKVIHLNRINREEMAVCGREHAFDLPVEAAAVRSPDKCPS